MSTAADIELQGPATDVSERVREFFGPYMGQTGATRLNLGCGREPQPGFVNLDRVAGAGADVVFDLEATGRGETIPLPGHGGPLNPFPANSVDVVLASHVLEHIVHLVPLMRELHRILKPGGCVCVVSPYASSDDAWEDPTHVRAFTEISWHYFDKRLYQKGNHAGSYPSEVDFMFDVDNVMLVPFPDLQLSNVIGERQTELAVKKRFMRNVIKEMHAVLRKVEG